MQNSLRKQKLRRALSIFKFMLLIGIALGIPAAIYFLHPEIIHEFSSLERINALLESYHTASIFVYIGAQIIQILISVIPGQMLQFAAGYAYSFWFGFLFSIIGIALGTLLTFYLSRLLGKDAMHLIFGEEKITHFVTLLSSKKAYMVIFILYLIPGFPKDLITYAAGVSEIQIRPYLILSLVGRTPALMVTIMMGSMTRTESYLGVVLLIAAVSVICLFCAVKHKQLIAYSDRLYDRLNHPKNHRKYRGRKN